jgi:gas vesicle protein
VTGREQRSSHTERVAHLKGRVEATRTIYVREIERLSNEIRATTALPDPTSDNVRRKLSDLQSRVSHLSEAFKQDMTPLNVELAQLQKEQDTQ